MDIKEVLDGKIPLGGLGLCLGMWFDDLTKCLWFKFKNKEYKEQVLAFKEMVDLKLNCLALAHYKGVGDKLTIEAITKYVAFLGTNPWFRR